MLYHLYYLHLTCATPVLPVPKLPYLHLWSDDQKASYQLELRRGVTTIFEEQGIIFSLIATLLSPAVLSSVPLPPQRASYNLTQILTTLFIFPLTFTSFTS